MKLLDEANTAAFDAPTPPVAFPLTLPILQIKYIYIVLFPCYDGLNKDEKVILWRKSWHI